MRHYIKEGQVIGSDGYTDLKVTKTGLKLHSTEGAELDYYDDDKDMHYKVKFDMDVKVNGKKNPNFGKMYYETDEDGSITKEINRLLEKRSKE